MKDKCEFSIPPAYHDLAHLLFMLEMSTIKPSVVSGADLIDKIDKLVSVIHANRILENSFNF
jgi:hypothetical protein